MADSMMNHLPLYYLVTCLQVRYFKVLTNLLALDMNGCTSTKSTQFELFSGAATYSQPHLHLVYDRSLTDQTKHFLKFIYKVQLS